MKFADLIAVSQTPHSTHHPENIVTTSVDSDLGSLSILHSCTGNNQLKGSIVDTREVARTARLMLFGSQRERVNVNTFIGRTSMAFIGLQAPLGGSNPSS